MAGDDQARAAERPDLELLDAWRDGDSAAADELVRRHFDSLCRFFRSKVDDGVDDLIQDTLLTCLARRTSIPEAWSFRTYLFVAARDRLVDRFRRRRPEHDFDAQTTSIAQEGASPSLVAEQRREQRLVLAALQQIPLDLQIALELHYWEGLAGAEIARVLDIPEGTVRSRLRRAHALLRERLGELAQSREELERSMSELERWAESVRKQA
ncbi:MAG TPA: sigma-70 family RNA polymerase sigma factor [Nannocystaceae bacterium]|nr:sigma-70 family RNA polymerase sigma factor [Nannocystaceae bacterium]